MYYYESNNYRTWRGMQKVKLKKQLKNLESERIIREIIELQKEIEECNKIDSAAIRRKEEWRNKEYQKKSKNENDEIIDDRRQNEYDGAVVFFYRILMIKRMRKRRTSSLLAGYITRRMNGK